jgi:hypothetical protein
LCIDIADVAKDLSPCGSTADECVLIADVTDVDVASPEVAAVIAAAVSVSVERLFAEVSMLAISLILDIIFLQPI